MSRNNGKSLIDDIDTNIIPVIGIKTGSYSNSSTSSNSGSSSTTANTEINDIINSVVFTSIKNMLNQFSLGNMQYIVDNLNIDYFNILSLQIKRPVTTEANTILFKQFIGNILELLYNSVLQVVLLNQYKYELGMQINN